MQGDGLKEKTLGTVTSYTPLVIKQVVKFVAPLKGRPSLPFIVTVGLLSKFTKSPF
jgi:hypothetical protein